jgi:hypothetical protein
MPQLDKVTFLSQFFWLCFFYIGLYFAILKFFLPKMSLILKLRHNKLTGSLNNVNSYTQQNKKIQTNLNTLFNNALITSKNTFNKSFNLIETWLHNTVENTEKKHFVGLNKKYILVVGESKLSENLFLNVFTPEIYKNIYMYSLLNTLKTSFKTHGKKKR